MSETCQRWGDRFATFLGVVVSYGSCWQVHKLSTFKQPKLGVLWFWRSDLWHETKHQRGRVPSKDSRGEVTVFLFQLLEDAHLTWLVATFSMLKVGHSNPCFSSNISSPSLSSSIRGPWRSYWVLQGHPKTLNVQSPFCPHGVPWAQDLGRRVGQWWSHYSHHLSEHICTMDYFLY